MHRWPFLLATLVVLLAAQVSGISYVSSQDITNLGWRWYEGSATFPNSPLPVIANSYFWIASDSIHWSRGNVSIDGPLQRLVMWTNQDPYSPFTMANRNPAIGLFVDITTNPNGWRLAIVDIIARINTNANSDLRGNYTYTFSKEVTGIVAGNQDTLAVATTNELFTFNPNADSTVFTKRGTKTAGVNFRRGANYFHPSTNRAFFGCQQGMLAVVSLDDQSDGVDSFQTVTVAVGDVNALVGVTGGAVDYLYLGTSSALIVQVRLDTLRINTLIIASPPIWVTNDTHSIYKMEIDRQREVLFYRSVLKTASNPQKLLVGRVNLYDGQFTDSVDGVLHDQLSYSGIEHNVPNLFIGSDKNMLYWAQKNTIYRYNITQCAYSCDSCTSDRAYCGFCAGQVACTNSPDCTSTLVAWNQNPVCPSLNTISPSSGSVGGGTSVTLTGDYFVPGANYECIFGAASPVTATSITSTSLVCQLPSGTPGTVNVYVRLNGKTWGNVGNFTYYDCSVPTGCSSCLNTGSECKWCLATASCSVNAACTLSTQTTCPALSYVSVPSSIAAGGGSVVLQSNIALPTSGTYSCQFGGASPSPASADLVNRRITCDPVPALSAGFADLQVFFSANPFAPALNFEFYECFSLSACSDCLAATHPECRFCGSESLCAYSNYTECGSSISQCPSIASTLPPTAYVNEVLTVNVTGSFIGSNGSSLTCNWEGHGTTPATLVNVNTVSCQTPNTLPKGDVALSINSYGSPFTNSINFTVYDCSDVSCNSCVDAVRHPTCGWCSNDAGQIGCGKADAFPFACEANRFVTISQSQCPAITSSSPNSDSTDGNTLVWITGTGFITNATRLSCKFGSMLIPVINATSTTVLCTTPAIGVAGNATVQLVADGVTGLTPPSPFLFYDCEHLQSELPSQCSTCLDTSLYPACIWCGINCHSFTNCSADQRVSTCPALSDFAPSFGSSSGGEAVSFTGLQFPAGNYECRFATTTVSDSVVGTQVSPTEVTCLTPPFPAFPTVTVSVTLYLDGQLYVPGSFPYTFYQCSSTRSCDATCVDLSYCGWCAATGTCAGQKSCFSSQNSTVWLQQCPLVTAYAPSHVQIQNNNTADVQETLAISVSGVESIADSSLLACKFGSLPPVPLASFTNGVATCDIPVVSLEQEVNLVVTYAGLPLTNFVLFKFLDCTRARGDCLKCVASKEECGFCLPLVGCSTQARCDYALLQDSLIWADADCPELIQLTPQSGFTTGGDVLTLTGSLFLNRPSNMTVKFIINNASEPFFADVSFISPTHLEVTSPVVDVDGVANVYLLFDDKPYTRQVQSFTFNPPPNTALIVGSTVGPIAFALLAVVIVVVLVLRRRRMLMFAIQLKEPDYLSVSYGEYLNPMWKLPKDNYDVLANLLKHLNVEMPFVLLINAITGSTEQDAVAKALVIFYSYHQLCHQAVTIFSINEINNCIAENTIFRNNSLASRMFKFYSKILGIPYLFHTLARFIVELNTIGDSKNIKNRAAGTHSLLTLDMELDANKLADQDNDNVDTEANLYQLILACQKVFNALQKALPMIPFEFVEIFAKIRDGIMNKWPESSDAVYKAVGGFLFLRFICPALTAPHVYGLLTIPPNAISQRQLVLIGKVVQNLANLVRPSAKEQFMLRLTDFFDKNIPKMLKFYIDILARYDAPPVHAPETEKNPARNPPQVVANNSLGYLWSHMYTFQNKVRAEVGDDKKFAPLKADVDHLFNTYKESRKLSAKKNTKADLKEKE